MSAPASSPATPTTKKAGFWQTSYGALAVAGLVILGVVGCLIMVFMLKPDAPVSDGNASVRHNTPTTASHSTGGSTSSEWYNCGASVATGTWNITPARVPKSGDTWEMHYICPLTGWPNGREIVRIWDANSGEGKAMWGDQMGTTVWSIKATRIGDSWKLVQEKLGTKEQFVSYLSKNPDRASLEGSSAPEEYTKR